MKCNEKKLEKQRKLRAENGNAYTKKYEKTKKGFLMRLYRNMESRITGVQKQKHHLYCGKYLLSRQEFYDWALNNEKFHDLFEIWEKTQYPRKLTPSVDRIDSTLGYYIKNMQWLTHSQNSARTSRWRLIKGQNYNKNSDRGKISLHTTEVIHERACDSSQ